MRCDLQKDGLTRMQHYETKKRDKTAASSVKVQRTDKETSEIHRQRFEDKKDMLVKKTPCLDHVKVVCGIVERKISKN